MNFNSSRQGIDSSFVRYFKFSVLLVLEPPALLCNGFLVFYLLTDRNLRTTLHHHVILLLLLVTLVTNLVEIPRILTFLRLGVATPQTTISCLFWQWADYLLYGQGNVLMMWASFERHLFVFHNHLFGNARRRFLYHYLPLVSINVYLILFYIVAVFLHPCQKTFHFTLPLCGQPCFTDDSIFSLYDLFVHSWLPIVLIVVFSLGLILRVLYPKVVLRQQQVQWRRYRRMVLQLCAISSLYMIIVGPYCLMEVLDLLFGLPERVMYVKSIHLFYLYWLLTLLLPFVCLGCLPEVTNRFRQQVKRWIHQHNAVLPVGSIAN